MKKSRKLEPGTRIIEAADRLFYKEGIRATGTEKIMAISEVAKATFYRHFPSKDALVLAYLDNRDHAFWDYMLNPSPPRDIREALEKIHNLVNHPQTTGCPFLRVASEYPETSHPFHCRVIEHKNKLLTYVAEMLRPYSVNRKVVASKLLTVIDGALSVRMVYGTSKEVPLLASGEAILNDLPARGSSDRGAKPSGSLRV